VKLLDGSTLIRRILISSSLEMNMGDKWVGNVGQCLINPVVKIGHKGVPFRVLIDTALLVHIFWPTEGMIEIDLRRMYG